MLFKTETKTYVVVEFVEDRRTGWRHFEGPDLSPAFNKWMSATRTHIHAAIKRDSANGQTMSDKKVRELDPSMGNGLQALRYARARDAAGEAILLSYEVQRPVQVRKHVQEDGKKAETVAVETVIRPFFIEVHALHNYPDPPKTTEAPGEGVKVEGEETTSPPSPILPPNA